MFSQWKGGAYNPQRKLYEYRPKIVAGSDEMKQFIEMCFDPQSPMNERFKDAFITMLCEAKKED